MRSSLIQAGTQPGKVSAPILPTISEATAVTQKRATFEEQELARKEGYEAGLAEGKSTGYAEGYAKGHEAGLRIGTEEARVMALDLAAEERKVAISALTTSLNAVVDRLQSQIPAWFERSEEQMADLVGNAVRKLLADELSHSREYVLQIVKEALAEVTHSRHARIRLNPFDSAVIKQHRAEIMAVAGSLRDIEFVDDESISGGCVIETEGGLIDAAIETRLLLFEAELEKAA